MPLPHEVDNDQLQNAKRLAESGGAWCIEQKELTPERLASALSRLLGAPDMLQNPDYQTAGARLKNRDALNAEIETYLQSRDSADWVEHFNDAGGDDFIDGHEFASGLALARASSPKAEERGARRTRSACQAAVGLARARRC